MEPHRRAQADWTITYEAIRVLRSRATPCTLIVTALVRVGPKAVTVTLRGTDGLSHYAKREK